MGLEGVCVGLVAWVLCFSALSFLCCCVFQAFVSSLSLLFLFSRVFQPFPFSLSLSVVSSAHLFLVLPSSPFFPLSLFLIPCAAAFSVGWGSRFQTLGASWASLELLASSCLPGGVAVRSLSHCDCGAVTRRAGAHSAWGCFVPIAAEESSREP